MTTEQKQEEGRLAFVAWMVGHGKKVAFHECADKLATLRVLKADAALNKLVRDGFIDFHWGKSIMLATSSNSSASHRPALYRASAKARRLVERVNRIGEDFEE